MSDPPNYRISQDDLNLRHRADAAPTLKNLGPCGVSKTTLRQQKHSLVDFS